ncbi:PLP-dependent aminotransferase family protein [Amphritea sp. HPY]|uniref:MocR-like pyridoxine biosynthesis transcription factor PdxR n=1 Tax=Amphritea sp. HPY TaxID=3421652 RepID=UPI003D7EEED2
MHNTGISSELFTPFLAQQHPAGKPLPRYRMLFNYLQQGIMTGKLQPATKLPSSRELAQLLMLSRNTVKQVYEMLQAEGYIETRHGAGSFVSPQLNISAGRANKTSPQTSTTIKLSLKSQQIDQLRPLYSHDNKQLLLPAMPAIDQFPWPQWQRSVASAGREMKFSSLRDNQGSPELRREIARYLTASRGIHCRMEQILICSGSQQGMQLAFSMLLNPGDKVLAEDPGFPGIDGAISNAGGIKVSIPIDSNGFRADLAMQNSAGAKVAFITPSRNFPIGYTLSLERRLALLQWARQNGSCIIEDDYDSEFRFDGPPLTAMQGLGGDDCVIYSGTFSRILHPSIRLGYLVLPTALVDPFTRMRGFLDGGLSALPQLALADFMAKGHFSSHLRRMRKLYKARRHYLLQQISEKFSDKLQWLASDGGMHGVFLLSPDYDDQQIAEQAIARGLGIRPLSYYYDQEAAQSGLIIGFAGYDENQMDKGLKILSELL